MTKINRKELITNIVTEHGYISVKELSKMTFTSESSIRRDLQELENQGVISRVYGGVRLKENHNIAAPFEMRIQKNHIEKNIISSKAAKLLQDNMTIILDGSTTALYMLPHIQALHNPTVFTNNMYTAQKSIERGIKTYCTGGTSENNSCVLTGVMAENSIRSIYADILFFSSMALADDGYIYGCNEFETMLRKMMIESSRISVFLCDSSKLHNRSIFTLCSINEIDYTICDLPEELPHGIAAANSSPAHSSLGHQEVFLADAALS